ncbi:hypothetical protein N656DRAFT_774190 [Canariomyces notabilis]|uniref:DUF1308 domain-containing protein n=1 Tax=Canariomyces notabilis TaxID=2074819 RepID=A0AAN6TL82_9PEZI|nr:hypothetical protein N656DRAFT_774190 [Canariomyces arenarius]
MTSSGLHSLEDSSSAPHMQLTTETGGEASTTQVKDQALEGTSLDECIESLITQWQICIDELHRLQQLAENSCKPVRGLSALLKVQQRALDKVVQKRSTPSASTTISPAQYFGIKSCCWEDRWTVVKKCRGLVAINKEFPRSPRLPVGPDEGWLDYKDQPFQEKTVAVDAVVDSGATWIKFISISPKSLEYQVMAEGWASEPEESDDEGQDWSAEGLGNTEFADTVKKIVLAARWNHCHRLHLILPGLQEGKSAVVDNMINYLRHRIGGQDVSIDVSCAGSHFLTEPPPPLDSALSALVHERDPLVADDRGRLTETLNLDPSALVALVTDLHHGPVPLQPVSQQKIIARSILEHETDNNELVARQDILATILYPALRGRKLVCTRLAANYFRKLIDAISTHSEEVRAGFILPCTSSSEDGLDSSPAQLRQRLQEWSSVPVPENLHLPVGIVDDVDIPDVDLLVAAGQLPPMARGVARDLSPLNRSVYCYGWAHRLTTVTGHRGIERQVRLSLARHWTRHGNDELPPDIWHRHLGGYLIHRDKPKDWRGMIPDGEEVPSEVVRWTNPWTTWGRGISTYGLPDTKTWEGVGHEEKTSYGRRMSGREQRSGGASSAGALERTAEDEDEEQS